MQSVAPTFKHEFRGHMGDRADGPGLHYLLLPQHPGHAKVSHFGSEAPLVIAVAGQQDVVA